MKLHLVYLLFLILTPGIASASETPQQTAAKADSLFATQKYTESFELYQSLLEEHRLASPAILLKMSFIKEGLGDYTQALYYINLYYLQTADKRALTKMEDLANAKNLEGYNFTDYEFAKTILFKYFNPVVIFLSSLAVFLVALMAYRKKKFNSTPLATGIFAVIVLAVLFYTINFGRNYDRAIVTQNNTYVMAGPSAGADVLDIIPKGHRLPIKSQEDVWTQTEWQGQKAYIRQDKLKPISFL